MSERVAADDPVAPRRVGAARLLALVYGFFVIAAGARSGVQIATAFSTAPLAYLLSAAAAGIYTAGLVAFLLAERRPSRTRYAVRLCVIELCAVVLVGLASVLVPAAFPDATVWSQFGEGYAFVPLVLPMVGLAWAKFAHRASVDPRGGPAS